jgi:hypothetical protein
MLNKTIGYCGKLKMSSRDAPLSDIKHLDINETTVCLILLTLVYIQFPITPPIYLCVHLDIRQGNSACNGTTKK